MIRLLINAGQAKPAPPVGPALGQAGVNIMSFCKDFNAKTADMKVGLSPRGLAIGSDRDAALIFLTGRRFMTSCSLKMMFHHVLSTFV